MTQWQSLCAQGKCVHAASERNPCRCPVCNAETRQMVARYQEEYMRNEARKHGATEEQVQEANPRRRRGN